MYDIRNRMKQTTPLDERIDEILDAMANEIPESEEYQKLLNRLEQLYNLKAQARPKRVSRDTLLIVGGNLLGILIIVAYEQKHVFNSKATPMLVRPKID